MFLFFKNQKRIEHNMKMLLKNSSKLNPVAIIKSRMHGRTHTKGIRSHFDADLPTTSIFCENAKVAINSRNFKPSWGLHNGACGTAIEIVFAKNGNPNNGDMPLYTVVEFPLYCGPVWDKDNPKVCISQIHDFPFIITNSISFIFSACSNSNRDLCLQKEML